MRAFAGAFAGFHSDIDHVALRMCSNPVVVESSKSTKVLILRDSDMYLEPSSTTVTPVCPPLSSRCAPEEPPLQFHAVFCRRPGHTAAVVISFLSKKPLPDSEGVPFSFLLWSLMRDDSGFSELRDTA
jgi:hypothetical protein